MGKTRKTLAGVTACLLLCAPVTVHAQTVNDLYKVYDLTAPDAVPEDVRQTLMAYNSAQIHAAKYDGLSSVTTNYDNTMLRIADYETQLDSCYSALEQAYSLDIETILRLEATIRYCSSQLQMLRSSMSESTVDIPEVDSDVLPSEEDYLSALEEKSHYATYVLGNVTNVSIPTTSTAAVREINSKYTAIEVPSVSSVLALFNGTVLEVDTDYIKIGHGNSTYTEFYGLSSIQVSPGDKVDQYQRIGSAEKEFQMSLNLNGEYYSLVPLLGGN